MVIVGNFWEVLGPFAWLWGLILGPKNPETRASLGPVEISVKICFLREYGRRARSLTMCQSFFGGEITDGV